MRVEQVGRPEWNKLSTNALYVSFGKEFPADFNRIDYALICCDDENIYSFATVIELNAEAVYMQHGGAMPNIQGTIQVKRCYNAVINWLKLRYKKISTRILNTNLAMLKLAMSEGLRVVGCDFSDGEIFLNLNLEVS